MRKISLFFLILGVIIIVVTIGSMIWFYTMNKNSNQEIVETQESVNFEGWDQELESAKEIYNQSTDE